MYQLGRLLQFVGLAVPPVAIMGNVAERLSLRDSLILSGAGIFLFFVGWVLQQGSKPP